MGEKMREMHTCSWKAMLLALLSTVLLLRNAQGASIETDAIHDASVQLIHGLTAMNKSTVDFLFHGDWGWPGLNQTLVGYQMGNWSEQHHADFVVALGDNFYYDGVWNDTDPLWDSAYRDVYVSASLQIPWYAVLGNHDYHRNPQAEIDYTLNHRDDRWTMPSHLFSAIYPIANSSETLQMVFIDTAILATNETEQTRPTGKNAVTPEHKAKYLRTLEHILARSTARWLLVSGHYTIYSDAYHGDTADLIACLVPLLRKYRVQAYFNGHDHVLQHLRHHGVDYFTSGRGALTDAWPPERYDTDAHDSVAWLQYVTAQPGFGTASVSLDRAAISFVDLYGRVHYTTTLTNPRTAADRRQLERSEERYDNLPVTMIACGLCGLLFGAVAGHWAAQKDSLDDLAAVCTCRGLRRAWGRAWGRAAAGAAGGRGEGGGGEERSPLSALSASQHGLLADRQRGVEEAEGEAGGEGEGGGEVEMGGLPPPLPARGSAVNMTVLDDEAIDL